VDPDAHPHGDAVRPRPHAQIALDRDGCIERIPGLREHCEELVGPGLDDDTSTFVAESRRIDRTLSMSSRYPSPSGGRASRALDVESIIIVTNPVREQRAPSPWALPRCRSDWSCPVMNPTGTMPYFFAAVSSFFRALARAARPRTHLLEARQALRTCASSLIGRRRFPLEST
jgi:hypothetical protein